MKKVAIIGIQGVPAHYGGFETLVENIIGENCSPEIEYTIFCSAKDYKQRITTYKGARLRYVPCFHANGMQSVPYDVLSMMCSVWRYDTVVVLGVSGCVFLPLFRLLFRGRLIVNIDGIESRRTKWGGCARWFLLTSESMAVHFADAIIADNQGIQNYVKQTYRKDSVLIAYGGNHAKRDVSEAKEHEVLDAQGLSSRGYAVSVCRIEPENNCHITLEAFAKCGRELVLIGNWKHSRYGLELMEKYGECYNIHMLESIYDLDVLYVLRKNAAVYVHGHSAGGTNPSLVEAMFFGRPILAYDVVYNRATTHDRAYYYSNTDDLVVLLQQDNLDGKEMKVLAERHYTWERIAKQYESLY